MALRRKPQWLLLFAIAVGFVLFLQTVLQLHNVGLDRLTPGEPHDGASIAEQIDVEAAAPLSGRQKAEAPEQHVDSHAAAPRSNQHFQQSQFEDVNRVVKELIVTSSCANLTRPQNVTYAPTGEYWQMNKQALHEIHVISAFYDDRPPVGILPIVRVLSVATLSKNATLYCHIWYSGLPQPYVTRVITHSAGRGERVYGVKYGQWLYSCKLPSSLPVPTHVSISYSQCEPSPMYIPIYVPVRSPWQHEFGICVAIAFGRVDFDLLVEWVEFNRMFGVTEINIYNASMSVDMNKVFDYYIERGVLRVHQMPPPQHDYGKRGSKVSSPASLNDCMLRNAYRYRYMMIIDFDEFIVPKTHTNYSSMLKAIDQQNALTQPWLSYSFRNEYYFFNYNVDDTQPKYLRTMRYREHAKPSKYLYAPKSFIDPLQCLSVFNHYCWIRFPGSPKKFTIDVKPDIATSHHYRSCGFGKTKCKAFNDGKAQEDYILQYSATLNERVSNVLLTLGLLAEDSAVKEIVAEKASNKLAKGDTNNKNAPKNETNDNEIAGKNKNSAPNNADSKKAKSKQKAANPSPRKV